MKKIVAISGSTKSASTNMSLIKAIKELTTDIFDLTIFDQIAALPHFNPDLDYTDTPPAEVAALRQLLKSADGILICTPEYAMGVPGSLKNAIDWTVSSCEFSHKPTALITASSVGLKGHASLMETLKIIEANITEETQLVISYAKTKIGNDHSIKDEHTFTLVKNLLAAFHQLMPHKSTVA